ncbi:MAG: hypothetical protein QM802_20925 [Agriterribacter sp.]
MENLSVLTDFNIAEQKGKYTSIHIPADVGSYSIHSGANFIFVTNAKNRTVRFSRWQSNASVITDNDVRNWIKQIKERYTQF